MGQQRQCASIVTLELARVSPGLTRANLFFVHLVLDDQAISDPLEVKTRDIFAARMAFSVCDDEVALADNLEHHRVAASIIGSEPRGKAVAATAINGACWTIVSATNAFSFA